MLRIVNTLMQVVQQRHYHQMKQWSMQTGVVEIKKQLKNDYLQLSTYDTQHSCTLTALKNCKIRQEIYKLDTQAEANAYTPVVETFEMTKDETKTVKRTWNDGGFIRFFVIE